MNMLIDRREKDKQGGIANLERLRWLMETGSLDINIESACEPIQSYFYYVALKEGLTLDKKDKYRYIHNPDRSMMYIGLWKSILLVLNCGWRKGIKTKEIKKNIINAKLVEHVDLRLLSTRSMMQYVKMIGKEVYGYD